MKMSLKAALLLFVGAIGGYGLAAEHPLERYLPLTAAPENHRPILENDSVRVLDVRIAPGDTVPAHQHDLPSVFITLSAASLAFRGLGGELVREVRRLVEGDAAPQIEWRDPPPAPRSVTNVDTMELHALRIELKRPSP